MCSEPLLVEPKGAGDHSRSIIRGMHIITKDEVTGLLGRYLQADGVFVVRPSETMARQYFGERKKNKTKQSYKQTNKQRNKQINRETYKLFSLYFSLKFFSLSLETTRYVVSVTCQGKIRNFKISHCHSPDGTSLYHIAARLFPSLPALIDFYMVGRAPAISQRR